MAPQNLLSAASLVVVVWGLSAGGVFLIPLCLAALLAFLMAPLVKLLRRIGVPELASVVASAFVLILPFSAIGYLLFRQGQSFIEDYPRLLRALETSLHRLAASSIGQKLQLDGYLDPAEIGRRIASEAAQGVSLVISGLSAVLSATSQMALVLLFTVLMLASRRNLRLSGERIFASLGPDGPGLLDDVAVLIERFLVARLLIVIICGAANALILVSFGIDYGLLLGFIMGVLTLVPAIGFILGLLPAIIIALATGHSLLSTAVLSLLLVVVSLIEGNVLTPKMVGHRLNINALATFVGLFAGGLLWGVWGMILAIPALGIMRIVFAAIPSLRPWAEALAAEPLTPRRRSKPVSTPRGRPPDRYAL